MAIVKMPQDTRAQIKVQTGINASSAPVYDAVSTTSKHLRLMRTCTQWCCNSAACKPTL